MNIDLLLDYESQTIYSIFIFLKENTGFHTINEISEHIGFERRTTIKYLDRLEELSLQFEPRTLIVSDKKYQLTKNNYFAKKELALAIYHISFKINLIEDLLFNDNNTIKRLMNEYNLSCSTLKKNIYEIKEYFFKYDIKLQIKNDELILSGLEPVIRLFFLNFFWRLYGGFKSPFDIESSVEKNFILEKIGFLLSDQIDPVTKIQYDYLIDITLIRYLSHHRIGNNELPIESILIEKKFTHHFDFISEDIFLAYPDLKAELYFFLLFLQTKVTFYRNSNFLHEIKKYHQEIDSNIFQANQFFIQNIGLLFNQFQFDYIKLEEELFAIHTRLLFKGFYNYIPFDDLYTLYSEEVEIIQENLRSHFKNISSRNSLIHSQFEYALLLYSELSIANEFMTNYELSVFVDNSVGELNSIWLKSFYTKCTSNLVKLNFIDPSCYSYMHDKIDLIISANKSFPTEKCDNIPILFLECKNRYEDLEVFQTMVRNIMINKNQQEIS